MKKLSNFDLKIFAIIFMIIDHIGYFFSFALSSDVYITFRIIGRLAMPIFAYLVAEGIYYTKDIKKYIARLGIFAIVTQALLILIDYIQVKIGNVKLANISSSANILFSFMFAAIVIMLICKFIEKAKKTFFVKNKNLNLKDILKNVVVMFFEFLAVIFIFVLFKILKFDYGINAFLLVVLISIINKIYKIRNIERIGNLSYYILVFLSLFLLCFPIKNYSYIRLFSIVFILFYSGKKGKYSKYLFYIAYLLQYIIISISSIIVFMHF